jgi:phytoene synthase
MSRPAERLPSSAGPDALLREGYRRCAQLTRRHGTTYFWGAALLPPAQRRHVHAVYALCRLADDIVDADGATAAGAVTETSRRLAQFADTFRAARSAPPGAGTTEPVLAAVVHTVRSCEIADERFDRFFAAMAQDLTTTRYESWEDLLGYMDGSAAVIGEMMLPVLRPTSTAAFEPARALGVAFQLTNFLRDVGEDLDRGRVYLPQEDLRRFRVDPAQRRVTDGWRDLMRFQLDRNRRLYARADDGIPMLPPSSARCVAAARVLYSRILDRIEANDYDVFTTRATVPTWRKAALSARMMTLGRAPRKAFQP